MAWMAKGGPCHLVLTKKPPPADWQLMDVSFALQKAQRRRSSCKMWSVSQGWAQLHSYLKRKTLSPNERSKQASPPRASCATYWFLMGQLDVGWTLDWTKGVPVAWSSKRRGVEALSQSCAWPRLPGHADASAVTPCRPWLLPHYALLWRGDGHWRGPRTRGQSISGSRVQPAPQQALCAPVFSACGLLQPVAVGAIVRAEALEHLLRAGEGPPAPHSVAWSFREKSLICSTGTSIGNKE